MHQTEYVMVMITAGDEAEAKQIATCLVEQRLAACVQTMPVQSTYRWEGKVQHDAEWLLLVKTTRTQFDAITSAVTELHSYDVPEIITADITNGSPPYLHWINEVVE